MKKYVLLVSALSLAVMAQGQSVLYPQMFNLGQVKLLDGPFRHAMELNDSVLLAYDAGRLLQPFEKEAGLPQSGEPFVSWGSADEHGGWTGYGLDGHVGGHYITALAQAYASADSPGVRNRLKQRLDSVVARIALCQQAWNASGIDCMKGYCGGVPHSATMWPAFHAGDGAEYWRSWVPFYNVHKLFNGLRDAYVYAGNKQALKTFLALCDWGIAIVENLTDEQLEGFLNHEIGGMNEPFADAFMLTGEKKYLEASKRYAHKWLLNPMVANEGRHLSNKHSNTQVPKVVGFERTYQLDPVNSAGYGVAARNFWNEVVWRRSLAHGGNAVNEWFPDYSEYDKFLTDPNGVETCSTYNMLKLSELLFADSHDSRYADYYERALFNHILSSQNPHTGGYVYFTSSRPQHYRVYSTVNSSMWCCVGSGMENHAKYGMFIYTHSGNDSVYVNLFIPSRLTGDVASLTQTTSFPYEPGSLITIDKGGSYTLNIRHPRWCTGGFEVAVNGKSVVAPEVNGYLPITRKWRKGDTVKITMPMSISVEPLEGTDYVAFTYGPMLLGAETGKTDLQGLFGADGRMDQCAAGPQYDLYSAPLLIGDRARLADAVEPVDCANLKFRISGTYLDKTPQWKSLVLEPFSNIHECRYMTYWLSVDENRWNAISAAMKQKEREANELEERTIDFVDCGTQQSEADHMLVTEEKNRFGVARNEHYRDGNSFSYLLDPKGCGDVVLMVRYWGGDKNRKFNITIDGEVLSEVSLDGGKEEFVNVEYPVPQSMLQGKEHLRVGFEVQPGGECAGGVYYVRLLNNSK